MPPCCIPFPPCCIPFPPGCIPFPPCCIPFPPCIPPSMPPGMHTACIGMPAPYIRPSCAAPQSRQQAAAAAWSSLRGGGGCSGCGGCCCACALSSASQSIAAAPERGGGGVSTASSGARGAPCDTGRVWGRQRRPRTCVSVDRGSPPDMRTMHSSRPTSPPRRSHALRSTVTSAPDCLAIRAPLHRSRGGRLSELRGGKTFREPLGFAAVEHQPISGATWVGVPSVLTRRETESSSGGPKRRTARRTPLTLLMASSAFDPRTVSMASAETASSSGAGCSTGLDAARLERNAADRCHPSRR